MLKFEKFEGLGNDFIIPCLPAPQSNLSCDELLQISEAECKRWAKLCDRKRSIGADGVLIHRIAVNGEHTMKIVNSDGSVAEMCGNGLRCFGRYLQRHTQRAQETFVVHTLAGMMQVQVTPKSVRCEIGAAHLNGMRTIECDGTKISGHSVSTGNPHFIIFESINQSDRLRMAPMLSSHHSFEHGANISFAERMDKQNLRLKVYERGCGWTEACGTAATATTAAYWHQNGCEGVPMSVHLPGGSLTISGGFDQMVMDGPSTFLFEGLINFEL